MELYAVVDVVKDPGTRLTQVVSILEGPFGMETPGVTEQDVEGWARENVASMIADHMPDFAIDSIALQRLAEPGPIERRVCGPVRVELEMPALPEGVGADLHLVVKPESEQQARETLDAFGGIAAFEELHDSAWPVAHRRGDGLTIGVQLPRERPAPMPFVVELRAEQKRASSEVEESEQPGPPNPPATDERPVG